MLFWYLYRITAAAAYSVTKHNNGLITYMACIQQMFCWSYFPARILYTGLKGLLMGLSISILTLESYFYAMKREMTELKYLDRKV